MVEVFRTNVTDEPLTGPILQLLALAYPGSRLNFDLDDADKILRIVHHQIDAAHVVSLLQQYGIEAERLV